MQGVATDLIMLRPMHVRLAVCDNVLRTLVDCDQPPNARVCCDVDAVGFVDYWLDRIHSL